MTIDTPVAPPEAGGWPVRALLVALLALPWLWPFASGPTPAVLPWLASVACGAVFLLIFLARPANLNRVVAPALLVAALTSSVIGLLQYFGASAALAPWINGTAPGYAFGNLRQRNQLASLINIGLVVLVWSAWARQARRASALAPGKSCATTRGSWRTQTWPTALAVVLLASANAATASRTGLLQLLALPVLALAWRRQSAPGTWPILGGAVLAYALAAVLLPLLAGLDPLASGIVARFGEAGQSCESRLILWRNVLYLIAQKPWFGWGWGELDYAHFVTLYPDARFCDILDNAHNLPLHLAVELGVPVAVLVCAVLAWLLWRARPWREARADRQMAWAVLALIALHSLLEYPLWYGPFQLTLVSCLLLLWQVARSAADSAPLRRALTACASVLLAALAYAAWDYWRVSQIYMAAERRAPAYRHDTLLKIEGSWLYRRQVRFAALTTSTVDAGNAAQINQTARQLLHFSPEPRVIEKLLASARVLHRDDELAYFVERYRAAFAQQHARWLAAQDDPDRSATDGP